jgi:hypothetical protein
MKLAILPLLALATGAIQTASASLILVSPIAVSGAGLGTVNTILTVQSPGSTTTETGCVGAAPVTGAQVIGAGTCFGGATGGDEHTGNSQTQLRTIANSGADSATDFRIVLNAVEPSGDGITVDQLSVRFYSPTGVVLYTASTAAAVTIPNTQTGTGNAGFAFGLDAAQAAAATTAGAFSSTSNLIGLSASLSAATGGPDTFFVGNANPGGGGGGVGGPIPEPATFTLLGSVLLAVGLGRRWKKA